LALKLIEPGKRKGNKYYLILGMEAGTQYEVSTRTTDKKLAHRRLDELKEKLDGAPRSGSRITFSQAADLYIEYRSPALQDRRLIEKLREAMGRMPVTDIRQADLVQVANRLYPQLTAASRNRNVMRPAGSVLHYAARNGYCAWLRIEHFKEPRPVTRAAAPEVGAQLFQATDGAKRLLVTWLFCQGTRISDTLRVRWEHIDLDRRVVALRTRKTDKDRVFPLHDDVLSLLRGMPEDMRAGRLFPWPHKNNGLSLADPSCSQPWDRVYSAHGAALSGCIAECERRRPADDHGGSRPRQRAVVDAIPERRRRDCT
jgi:integrase